MPLYTIQKTAQKGQVLLVSEEKRGVCPVVSIQLPEEKAKQIVCALNVCAEIADVSGYDIDHMTDKEIRESFRILRDKSTMVFRAY